MSVPMFSVALVLALALVSTEGQISISIPDLVVLSFRTLNDPYFYAGATMENAFEVVVLNNGTGALAAGASITATFVFSPDTSISASADVLIGRTSLAFRAGLPIGGSATLSFNSSGILLPSPTALSLCGPFYVGVVVGMATVEATLNNNAANVPCMIFCKPELVIESFSLSGSPIVGLEESIGSRISLRIRNYGLAIPSTNVPAGFFVGFSVSKSANEATRLLRGGREYVNTTGGMGQDVSVNVPLYSGATVAATFPDSNVICGPAYLVVQIDEFNAVNEAIETNNIKGIPITVVCESELYVNQFALSRESPVIDLDSTFGSDIIVSIGNLGKSFTGLVDVNLYVREGPSNLRFIATRFVTEVPQGNFVDVDFSGVKLSSTYPTSYSPDLCGDGELVVIIDESASLTNDDVSNNNATIPVTINCPDFSIDSVKINGATKKARYQMVPGETFTVTVKISNVGASFKKFADIPLRLFYSDDAELTAADSLLMNGETFVNYPMPWATGNSISPKLSVTYSLTYPFANSPSKICSKGYVIAVIDQFDVFPENNELNNIGSIAVSSLCLPS